MGSARIGLSTLLAAVLLTGCASVPMVGQSEFGEKTPGVYGTKEIGQEFLSTDRNLTRVDIFLSPSLVLRGKGLLSERRLALRGLSGKNLNVRVYSLPAKKRVANLKLPVKKIRNTAMHTFPFKPQADSKGRRYLVTLSAPELTANDAISVRLTDVDKYADGSAFVNGKPVKTSDLRFLPFISMTPRMVLNSVASRMTADVGFLVFWVVAVLAASVLSASSWARAGGGPDHNGDS